MKTKSLKIAVFSLMFGGLLFTRTLSSYGQSPLDSYIREGLANNLVLQQKNISYDQAQQSLQIAKSYFLPSITLLADYTSGEGGRSISIPVGDLLNPVYTSLNQLTQSDAFPQIENVSENFFPKNFYDGRVRTSVPIINTDLYINRAIQGQQVLMKQFEVDVYRRQLVYEIKSSYFKYRAAQSAVKIYESALTLVSKNVEVNKSLVDNGKGLPANLMRSRSELERVKAELNSLKNQALNARRYFNFLLNRDQELAIEEYTDSLSLQSDSVGSVEKREELQMLRTAKAINQSSLRLNRLAHVPKVNAFLDLGSQASNWEWNQNSQYYLFGVQVSMPLFQGFRTNTAIRQSRLEIQKADLNILHTTQQLNLAVSMAANDLQTARQNYVASGEQLRSAQSYYNLVDKGYQQGVNSLIEFLDARNQLTSSQLQQNVKLFEVLTAEAKLERESATYSLEQ